MNATFKGKNKHQICEAVNLVLCMLIILKSVITCTVHPKNATQFINSTIDMT